MKAKNVVENQKLESWFDELLEETFTIMFEGKEFVFKKRYPSSILESFEGKNQGAITEALVSYLSVSPKISLQTVRKMPGGLLNSVGLKIKEYNLDITSGEE